MAETFSSLSSQRDAAILHELELGQHTLFILQDHSVDIVDFEGAAPYLADNGIHLDSDETYRLFITLSELFKLVQRHDAEPFPLTICREE